VKRSPELTPLSHDHHQALFVAQRLKRAEDAGEARDRFLDYWRSHGRSHFVIEEEILLPGWALASADADRAQAARVSAEHLEIRAAARRAEHEPLDLEALRELGELLERHVRFEERELFPAIEAQLDAEQLAELGAEIERAEGGEDSAE
jgi:hemerythrin-like domain-containing protein